MRRLPNLQLTALGRRIHLLSLAGLFALTLSFIAAASHAQPSVEEHPELHPNLRRGASLSGVVTTDAGWGKMNLFNGNLMFEVPLGHSYPVSEHFGSYRFSLHYNSNVWDFRQQAGVAYGEPLAASNAGLGFDLSLGRLLAPGSAANRTTQWVFVDPDGTAHLFYSDLHFDTPDAGDPNDNFQYSRDGSYLRFKRVSSAQIDIERPAGHYLSFTPFGTEWRVTRAARRKQAGSGQWTVAYAADGSSWTVSDTHGRSHRIVFVDDPSGVYDKLVDRVELSAFAGATAVYTFAYEMRTVPRHCSDSRGGTVTVPFLTAITDPTGYAQTFDYWGAGDCAASGRLKQAKLIHGGFIEWDWGSYPFPPLDCTATTPAYLTDAAGVIAWRKVRPDGLVEGNWSYTTELVGGVSPCTAKVRATRETNPLGHHREHFFFAATEAANPDSVRYGLPGDATTATVAGLHRVSTVRQSQGSAVLRTVFEEWEQDASCSSPGANCFDTQRRLRAQRTRYDDDPHPTEGLHYEQFDFDDFDGVGHFRSVVRTANFTTQDYQETYTRYNPGRNTYLSGDPANGFVGWPVTGNWILATFDRRELRDQPQDSTPETSDVCFLDGELSRERRRAGVSPSSKDLIIDHVWSGAGRSEIAYYGGDLQAVSTGWLCATTFTQGLAPQYRILLSHQAGALASSFFVDGAGQRVYSENDVDQDIDTVSGLVAAQRDEAGVVTTFVYDVLGRRIRAHPESSQEAILYFDYRNPTGGSGWSHGRRIMIRAYDGEDGSQLRREFRWLDFYAGKIRGSYRYRNGGDRSSVLNIYNAMGWPTHVSTPVPAGGTMVYRRFLNYDPWGRPGIERPPEGSHHDITLSYSGSRETVRRFKAAIGYAPTSGNCSEQTVTETTQSDFLGRPRRIVEDRTAVAEGHVMETTQTHDAAGRLIVRAEKTTVGYFVQQSGQSFTYDGRGFLLERYRYAPGRSWSEGFSEIDPLGHAGRSVLIDAHHPSPGLALRHEHDRAGRVVRIADADDPSHAWKEFEFGDSNLADDLRRGKLVRSARFNHRYSAYVVVEDEYEYRAPGGRVSHQRVGVGQGPVNSPLPAPRSYSMTVAYDPLGQIEEIQYPECSQCASGQPALPRTVSYQREGHVYARHLVTGVHGSFDGQSASWIDGVTYGATMLPSEIHHANGVIDYGDEDPYRRARLANSRTEGSSVSYDAGEIVYDGSGAICGVGETSYVPEPTVIANPGPPAQCALSEVIDPFGGRTGEHTDWSCNNGTEAFFYDADDRLVGYLQQLAQKQTYYVGLGWAWGPDSSNWTVTWSLYGPAGTGLVRSVEEHTSGAWRATVDTISVAGRPVFEQTRRAGKPDESLHLHPMGAPSTSLSGFTVYKSLAEIERSPTLPALDAAVFDPSLAGKAGVGSCSIECPSLYDSEPDCNVGTGEILALGPPLTFLDRIEDGDTAQYRNRGECRRKMERRMKAYCEEISTLGCCDIKVDCIQSDIVATIGNLVAGIEKPVKTDYYGSATAIVRDLNECHPGSPDFSGQAEACCNDACGTHSLQECTEKCQEIFGCRGQCEPAPGGSGYVCKATARPVGTECKPDPGSETGSTGGGSGAGGGGDPSGGGGTTPGPIDGTEPCARGAGRPCTGNCSGVATLGTLAGDCRCAVACEGGNCPLGWRADSSGQCVPDFLSFF